MSNKSHFKLHQPVKIDGIDFETGVYPVDEIDAGRHSSIINAGWGEYCDAPKTKSKVQTSDDVDATVDPDEDVPAATAPTALKPARNRSRNK